MVESEQSKNLSMSENIAWTSATTTKYHSTYNSIEDLTHSSSDHDNHHPMDNSLNHNDTPLPGKVIPTSFLEDIQNWRDGKVEGTIPQGFVAAVVIGVSCGFAAFLYYRSLWWFLAFVWNDLPDITGFRENVSEEFWWLWIPFVGFTMAVCVGLSVVFLGEPGDLAYVVKCVHKDAYIDESHMIPMIAASQFSITGGGSLGPEAPLVAICAGIAGFISRTVLKTQNKNVLRKHTLMGMCAALAAFFGAPLGGSMFALEINSRFGYEYFEHGLEAVFAGEICLGVFRYIADLEITPIWFDGTVLRNTEPKEVCQGIIIGLLGAATAKCFVWFHGHVMKHFAEQGLLDNSKAVQRALVGATVIVLLGLLVPHTMFWGEYEIQQILTLAKTNELPHIWPTSGITGFQMNDCFSCFLVGVCKMIAISLTVAGGYRGGFIFPFFLAGSAFGRAISFVFDVKPIVASLCFAAGINVSITRTAFGTTLILSFLSGQENIQSAILGASIFALFATAYMPFIKTQIPRSDLHDSLRYEYMTSNYNTLATDLIV